MIGKSQEKKIPCPRRQESAQALVLVLILLAVAGGGWWMLNSSRVNREKEAWDFAREVATRVLLQRDERFLNLRIAPAVQAYYPPSWRSNLVEQVRVLGTPLAEIELTGEVRFTSQFFEPAGQFRARVYFPTGPTYLDMEISHPKAIWQIDKLNWTWRPPDR